MLSLQHMPCLRQAAVNDAGQLGTQPQHGVEPAPQDLQNEARLQNGTEWQEAGIRAQRPSQDAAQQRGSERSMQLQLLFLRVYAMRDALAATLSQPTAAVLISSQKAAVVPKQLP